MSEIVGESDREPFLRMVEAFYRIVCSSSSGHAVSIDVSNLDSLTKEAVFAAIERRLDEFAAGDSSECIPSEEIERIKHELRHARETNANG